MAGILTPINDSDLITHGGMYVVIHVPHVR